MNSLEDLDDGSLIARRVIGTLRRWGFTTVEELEDALEKDDVRDIRNVGEKSYKWITDVIQDRREGS